MFNNRGHNTYFRNPAMSYFQLRWCSFKLNLPVSKKIGIVSPIIEVYATGECILFDSPVKSHLEGIGAKYFQNPRLFSC